MQRLNDISVSYRTKPAGIHDCEVKWATLSAPPASADDIAHSPFDARSPFTLGRGEPERGKTVYLCLRWEKKHECYIF
ncbi:hypothetical protein FACS189430_11410 [Bacteroidia bacterium]|nr:hypothetical protein FACS189430_11410 [Bacteroidia bacterium]